MDSALAIDTCRSVSGRAGLGTTGRGQAHAARSCDMRSTHSTYPPLRGCSIWRVKTRSHSKRLLNRQKVQAGKTKALAIVEAAKGFAAIGVTEPAHLRPDDADHRTQYTGVSGLGPVTWWHFTMLLSHDGAKVDTWITEFVGARSGGACILNLPVPWSRRLRRRAKGTRPRHLELRQHHRAEGNAGNTLTHRGVGKRTTAGPLRRRPTTLCAAPLQRD